MITKDQIEKAGWIFKREYTREGIYGGHHPTQQEFEIGDVWKDNGRGGFLTFMPETSEIKIITTDKGFNQDGPNHSIKYQGKVNSEGFFQEIMRSINLCV